MKKSQRFDIFISYRREGGYDTAQLLYDRLTQMRYRVSFDLETLRGGKFNTQLYQRIEQCSDVLVIMSKDSLNLRENPDDDWFRLEIAHALKCGKNIVPVFLRDFKFPQKDDLPPDIADLVDYQGVTASQEHFDSTLQRICRNFKAKPQRRIGRIVGIAAFVAVLTIGVSVAFNADRIFPYPFTRIARQQVDQLVGHVDPLGSSYNDLLFAKREFLKAAMSSINDGSLRAYRAAIPEFMRRIEAARKTFDTSATSLEAVVRETWELRVDRAYVPSFIEGVRKEFADSSDWVGLFKCPCDPAYPCSKSDRRKLLELKERELAICADIFAYSVMALFDAIDPKALRTNLIEVAARQWTEVERFRGEWLTDAKRIEDNAEASIKKLQEIVMEQAQIIGDSAQALEQTRRDTREQLTANGATPESAQRIVDKFEELSDSETQLTELRKRLEQKKKAIREKFAPLMSDDPGILWGKYRRFMTVGVGDAAVETIAVLRRKHSPDFPERVCDVAEMVALRLGKLPFKGGIVVTGFEPPATQHAIFQIGDIVAEIDGIPIKSYGDYKERNRVGARYTVYRLETGTFKRYDAQMPAEHPRVGLVEILEQL